MTRPGYQASTIVFTPEVVHLGHVSGLKVDSYPLAPAAFIEPLPQLLERAATLMPNEGTLIVDPGPSWAATLKRYQTEGAAVRAAGWKFPGEAPESWTSFSRAGTSVHMGIMGAFLDRRGQIFRADEDRVVIAQRLAQYHLAIGAPYRMSLGTAGCAALRAMYRDHEPAAQPYWGMGAKPRLDDDTRHGAGDLQGWAREPIPRERKMKYAHKYDANAARLAAAINADPAWGRLRQLDGDLCVFDFSLHGYWLIPADTYVRPPWFPPVYDPRMARTGTIWVTTPTMVYLYGRGVKPQVIDAYAAKGRRWLRGWGERLDNARKISMHTDDARLTGAIKGTYKEAFGMMEKHGGSVFRFDVADEVYDVGRCNLLRRVDTIHAATKALPMRVHTDEVWYPSDSPNPLDAVPGFVAGVNLGQVKTLTIPMPDYMDGRRK